MLEDLKSNEISKEQAEKIEELAKDCFFAGYQLGCLATKKEQETAVK